MFLEKLHSFWNYTLITLGSGDKISVGQTISVLVFIVLALKLGRMLSRMLGRHMRRKNVDAQAIQTIEMLFYWIFLALVVITALGMLQLPITHLAFISGAVAVGVGFGAQNIINNLISSWILMSEKPVRIGDYIEVDQYAGTVERIGNRSTRIKRFDGVHIMVPNSQMLEKIVVNWTLVDKKFRTAVRVGVAYGTAVDRVEALLTEAALAQREVVAQPAPMVVFEEFGASALIFDLHVWCDTADGAELRGIRSSIRFTIEKLFRENGIEIAYPHTDVHLSAAKPLDVRLHPIDPQSELEQAEQQRSEH